jgi:c(7)-type cytochrome triheme protein
MQARTITSLKVLFLLAALAIFAASCLQQAEERTPVTITASETPVPPAARASDTNFGKFLHDVPEHKQFACDSCHKRDVKGQDIRFAGHEACIGCHLNEFTSQQGAICTICHQETKSVPPPVQVFPAKFEEGFNMKFDHAAHTRGEGLPREGCVACHESNGPGKTIPVGIRAHANCFTCHTQDKKIGQCSTCHELAPYNRTPPSRYVFRAVFRHSDHTRGIDCNDCHTVRPGAPQSRQVTNIVAQEHKVAPGNNCYSCHNGSRAFGGNGLNDFANCRRCHRGSGFDMLP